MGRNADETNPAASVLWYAHEQAGSLDAPMPGT
jgi:hypothetical protein